MTKERHCQCGAWIVTDGAMFRDYECGTSWDEIDGWEFSERCKNNREDEHERAESNVG